MPAQPSIKDLERKVDRFYQRHSSRRVGIAALIVAISSVVAALLVYMVWQRIALSLIVFGVSGLITINLVMYAIVPRSSQLKASRDFLIAALQDPARIREAGLHEVRLVDDAGVTRELKGLEMRVWQRLIIPYCIKKSTIDNENAPRPRKRRFSRGSSSAKERKDLARQRAELVAMERKIHMERERLDEDRQDLEQRSLELQQAEDMVVERLNHVERAQVEIQQLREDLEQDAARNVGANAEALREKETALHAKEQELVLLRTQLAEDRRRAEVQKDALTQVQPGKALEDVSTEPELDERIRYVDEVEDQLIARLHELSEREAAVEQLEINAGLRAG